MSNYINPGNYKAKAVASGIGVSNAKGTPYVRVTFRLIDSGSEIDWFGYVPNEAAQERLVKDLVTMGYKGTNPEELDNLDEESVGAFLPATVSLKIEDEVFQGNTRSRVRFVNPERREMEPGKSLFGDMRAAFAAARPGAPAAPKANGKPAPIARPAPVSDPDEDSIPFLGNFHTRRTPRRP